MTEIINVIKCIYLRKECFQIWKAFQSSNFLQILLGSEDISNLHQAVPLRTSKATEITNIQHYALRYSAKLSVVVAFQFWEFRVFWDSLILVWMNHQWQFEHRMKRPPMTIIYHQWQFEYCINGPAMTIWTLYKKATNDNWDIVRMDHQWPFGHCMNVDLTWRREHIL